MANETSKVTAISDQAKAIDELREQVRSISEAVEKIRKTGIREDALLALIAMACPPTKTPYGTKPGVRVIKQVISGMANLEAFVFGNSAKK